MHEYRREAPSHIDFDGVVVDPLNAHPERIAVPERAGAVRPRDLLCAERARVLKDWSHLVEDETERGPAPFPCHRVRPDDGLDLADRLLRSGVAVLVREDVVPGGVMARC